MGGGWVVPALVTITPPQWEALRGASLRAFSLRLRAALLAGGGAVAAAAERLPAEWFEDWVRKATGWGVTDQGDVYDLTELAMLAGERRLSHPRVREVLEDPQREAELKVFQVGYLLRQGDVG